tara:strand:+ start:1298 stop:2005 length:708 start_codon:yes stop_codon:yes gene_type:complete
MSAGRELEYKAGSVKARGYLAHPRTSAARGGILVLHEAPGVGAHVRSRADALAEQGFVALAADLHGEGRLAENPQEARQWVEALKGNPDELIARMEGALGALRIESGVANGNFAAAGYCFGGWCALELARTGAPLRSVSVFHGSVASIRGAAKITGSVLVCTGDADPFIPPTQIADFTSEMTAAGVDYQLCLYGGVGHGFTDPQVPEMPGFKYEPKADRRSWQSFLSLLAEHTAD